MKRIYNIAIAFILISGLIIAATGSSSSLSAVFAQTRLHEKTKRRAICIMYSITTKDIFSGKNPMSFAASLLYLASLYTGENKTQAYIASAAGVTEVTIRNRYRDLKRLGLHL